MLVYLGAPALSRTHYQGGQGGLFSQLTTPRVSLFSCVSPVLLQMLLVPGKPGYRVILCYSVALHDLVAPALGLVYLSFRRAPALCCAPVSPSGVIEEKPSAAVRVTRRKVRLRRRLTSE